jgi:glycosyltransferase involved in cell wall biosynthesis
MPRSPIEAQAMGLPAVATAIRGCREVVVDGETGRSVPERDRFDEAWLVERTLAVYERLLARWRSRGVPA